MREVVNGLMYVLSTGCQWRAIPKDLPPRSTVYDYFGLWDHDGTVQRLHHARSTSNVVSRPGARLVRWRPSSTARTSRARPTAAIRGRSSKRVCDVSAGASVW